MKLSINYSWIQRVSLFLAVLVYLHTEISEPLLLGPQVFISLFLALLHVVLWGFGSSEISVAIRRYLGPTLLASLLSVPLVIPIYKWQNTLTKRRADTIIQQLEKYQNKEGHYPESLTQLKPGYLTKLPRTAKGLLFQRPFRYSEIADNSRTAHSFWLGYDSGAFVEIVYDGLYGKWYIND
ncbi:hypothetical protein H8B13_13985 [Hymenobacter sp. BT188]|uniref:hypothetical protein n=1 Tax=Hymenobacter sp. BT188 TaxID=2763504 RepID=UPI0016519E2A|nr:hypothetical protein [Hymenobacter sp. BT188]MBC6607932.1 hypothetical protein [Hymenobacter sp. BT188]